MITWKALLLVYPEIHIRYRSRWRSEEFRHQLPAGEIQDAIDSFEQFPKLVLDLTQGEAGIQNKVVHVDRILNTLSPTGKGMYWPSPADTKPEIDRYGASGMLDSIFVLWPQNNFQKQTSIPSAGWGLGMGGADSTLGATYATVANTHSWVWQIPLIGEVWLHEWLHGVCYHFSRQGYTMPSADADGGSRHGYTPSPITGWTDYYRDLMTGQVEDNGTLTGIPLEAWQRHSRLAAE